MFTGIVEELGTVRAVERGSESARLTVAAETVLADAAGGDSIAVNGCCLTVADQGDGTFTADVMLATLERTSLGDVVDGAPVNLERAATLSTRLGGHLVQGHVDGVGTVVSREPGENWDVVTIDLPDPALGRYLVDQGSVAVDGVSLTVLRTTPTGFAVSLIPETLARTTLGHRQPGDRVNLEVDVLAKHVEKLLGHRSGAEAATGADAGEALR
jgi:riboflavin synthase